MKRLLAQFVLAGILITAQTAFAGGSYYTVKPGTKAKLEGKINEWPVPTPEFARDPAPAPDGNIYIAVMNGNKIARFNTETEEFNEWDLPENARPHGLLVDNHNRIWYTGYGNGTIGELNPETGNVTQHTVPNAGNPHTLIIDENGIIWFSIRGTDRLGRLDTNSGDVKSYPTPGGPYGLTFDHNGKVWVCLMNSNQMGKFDPETETLTTIDMGDGSMPRRVATSPDGDLWITLYGHGKLARLNPDEDKVTEEIELPEGPNGGAYAVSTDSGGFIWVNEINVDTVVRINSADGTKVVIKLPSEGVGIRKMIVDDKGNLWYMGSHNGRLGVIR